MLPHLPSSMDTLPFIPNKDQGKKIGKGVEENLGFKELNVGFPGSSVGMNLPTNVGDTDLIPYLGRYCMPWINKACEPQLLSLYSKVLEPQLLSPCFLEPMLCNKRSH